MKKENKGREHGNVEQEKGKRSKEEKENGEKNGKNQQNNIKLRKMIKKSKRRPKYAIGGRCEGGKKTTTNKLFLTSGNVYL